MGMLAKAALEGIDAAIRDGIFAEMNRDEVLVTKEAGYLGESWAAIEGKLRERHAAIRDFQFSQGGRQAAAKVFVITMKTGSVGITLTAATRVYLMEPCLDPAMEVQAAGRIHRLGQTRDVFVKRVTTIDTVEHRMGLARRARQAPPRDPRSGVNAR